MSSREWLFRLEDILDAVERIQRYIESFHLEDFESDQRTLDAVVRNLEIMGEAARHLPDFIFREYPDVPWKQIRDMRNFLIHEYFGVHVGIIWQTITEDFLLLKPQLQKIKQEYSD